MSVLVIGVIPFASAETSYEEYREQLREETTEAEVAKDLTVTTDKKEYTKNQKIKITFSSDTFFIGRNIELALSSPSSIIEKEYLKINSLDDFSIVFETNDSRRYLESGTYTIKAGYDDARAETTFKLIVPNSPTPQPPEPVLKDSFVNEQVDPNEKTPQKEIELLKAENEKLKTDLDSMNQKLDSLNAVLLEQTKVLIDLAKSISELKNTLAQVFHFDIFA